MTKNKMKITRVVIMIIIMFGFSQANPNPSFIQSGSNNTADKLDCYHKCSLECLPVIVVPPGIPYEECCKRCVKNCEKKPPVNVVHNCIARCGSTKYTAVVNNGIRSFSCNIDILLRFYNFCL